MLTFEEVPDPCRLAGLVFGPGAGAGSGLACGCERRLYLSAHLAVSWRTRCRMSWTAMFWVAMAARVPLSREMGVGGVGGGRVFTEEEGDGGGGEGGIGAEGDVAGGIEGLEAGGEDAAGKDAAG